jgi:hypothetical protein
MNDPTLKLNIMKKIAFLLTFSFIFFSCEKDYLIPDKEVPEWLKARIQHDEDLIKDSPKLMYSYGAWLRYQWQNEFYFEYHNVLSESLPQPVSKNGDILPILVFDTTTEYYKEKSCKQYVWKAPEYDESQGMK